MKKLLLIVFIALVCTLVYASKTIWSQYTIVKLKPDSLVRVEADIECWGNFWAISSDTSDTANMTPDMFTIDSITIADLFGSVLRTDSIHAVDGIFTTYLEASGGLFRVVLSGDTLEFNREDLKFINDGNLFLKLWSNQTTGGIIWLYDTIGVGNITKITPTKIEVDSADVDLFTGEGTFDDKICFNDTVMLGDSADKIILPKGSVIELYDTTDTHKMQIYQTSTEAKFVTTKPLKLGTGNIWLGAGDTLYITSAVPDTYALFSSAGNLIIKGDGDFGLDLSTIAFDIDGDDSTLTFNWGKNAYFNMDTISYQLEWTGSGGIKAKGAVIDDGNLIVADGQKIVVTDGTEADSMSIYDDGSNARFDSDNDFYFDSDVGIGITPTATLHTYTTTSSSGISLLKVEASEGGYFSVYDGVTSGFLPTYRFESYGLNGWGGVLIGAIPQANDVLHTVGAAMVVEGRRADNTFLANANLFMVRNYTAPKFLIDKDGNITLGDTINTIFLPKGTQLAIANASNADTSQWYDDGDTTRFESDNPFDFGNSVTVPVICSNVSDTVASAATITLGNYNNFVITGTTNMDSIDTAGTFPNWGIAYIQFTGIASANGLTDGKNLKLEGNFIHSADDMIVLQRRGDIFYEISRSAN